uniref:ATP synthase F0 subunit 8 n=1 Tax=Friesea propria TaxID=2785902 RepID=B5KY13_9HEXA|nr:ATP synthase F0 subunit 8 [Friesea propria]ABV02144.1 ATP synthase F0 subunit 8 [Friesea propria]
MPQMSPLNWILLLMMFLTSLLLISIMIFSKTSFNIFLSNTLPSMNQKTINMPWKW